MRARLRSKHAIALVVPLALVACGQLQGLDDYEKVDCVDEGCDGGAVVTQQPRPDSSTIDKDADQPDVAPDAPATCPPCTGGTVCDPKSLKCVECLPGTKACTPGQFCDADEAAGFKCVQGCGTVQDCLVALGADAGPDAEAGIFDAGGDGGAGTLACCNNRCVDTAADGKNCGACNFQCGASAACCNSACQDIVSTATSCGGCGISCSGNHVPAVSCGARTCNGTCETGWADCNTDKLADGCETKVSDNPDKCGGCNVVCSGNNLLTRTCTTGTCTGSCASGFLDCNKNKQTDGCEIDIGNSPLNCGDCDKACSNNNIPAPTCGGGVCNGTCAAGFSDCDGSKLVNGCETRTSGIGADPNNCGGCGAAFNCSNANMATRTCNGTCNGTCAANFADCNNNKLTDGCETQIGTNPLNCGLCNRVCSSNHVPSPTCNAGTCNGTCETGWSDCNMNKQTDGCESRTDNDSLNCGGCNAPCTVAGQRKCVSGKCSAGYGTTSSSQAFVDACTQPGATTLTLVATGADTPDDEGLTAALNLPFGFTFGGTAYTQYWVWSNGAIGFGATPTNPGTFGAYACPGPDTAYTTPLIFAFLEDLKGKPTFALCAATIGTAPNRKLVVTFKNTAFYASSTTEGDLTFSAFLSETTNEVEVAIQTLNAPNGHTAVVGVQPSGTSVTTHSCAEPNVANGTQVRFIP